MVVPPETSIMHTNTQQWALPCERLNFLKKGAAQWQTCLNRESTLNRLRHRKVVQWTLVYVAGAWGFLQGLQYVSDAFQWAAAVRQIALLVVVLVGLPLVLVVAWYHGERGQQRVTGTELTIVTALLVLGGSVVWYSQRATNTVAMTSPSRPVEHAIPTDASIAVLPFVNMSADKEQDYFADGISEELLNLLAQVPELRVIARTSSFSFKGKDVDIDDIAHRLNVANVLEGSVRRSGDKLRITAQLVRASDSSHLWSHTYDRDVADVFAVQDEIAGAIVRELKIRLLGEVPTTRETDPRAYALFLQARQIGRQFTDAALAQSIQLYQQSLAIDPTYTAAWVGLAGAYFDQVNTGLRPADEGIGPAREAAVKALALDPQYAPVHARLAWIAMYYDRDLAAAARHLEQALALEPSNPDIIGAAANLARRLGRLDQAIALGRYQLARDPANSDGHYDLGLAYRYAGRLDDAIASFRTVLSLVPANIGSHATISEMLLQKDDPKAALAEVEQEPDEQWRLPVLSMVYHALGRRSESDAALAEVMKRYERTGSLYIASVLAFRGENDRAFAWLNKAIRQHDTGLGAVPLYPTLASLHSDPRWLPLLRRLSMAPAQLAAIKFDVTAPP